MKLTLVATCLFGLEKGLGEEIDALGYKRIETMDGRITFIGDETAVAAANIRLRCAERIYIQLAKYKAETFEELYEGAKAAPLENWIGRNDAFPVKGHAIKSQLTSIPDCQSILKKAMADRLGAHYGVKWLNEAGIRYQIEFFLFKNICTLMIDTSGTPLHKRGYRPVAGPAPLRETLAAGIAGIGHLRPDVLLWDPFCGSGTIAIESAMMLLHIAPGVGRNFAGEEFPQLNRKIWDEVREAARSEQIADPSIEIYASDIDDDVLDTAYENAVRAGVEPNIRFFNADARTIRKEDRRGTIICNPPYGERLSDIRSVEALYRDIGKNFAELSPWQIYILTSCDYFERLYGRRADKVRKLYNGMIPCNLYQFFRPQDKNNKQ